MSAPIVETGCVRALIGSVAVHAVLVWAIVDGDRGGAPRGTGTLPAAITVVEAVEVDVLPGEEPPARDVGGAPAGGAPANGALASPPSAVRSTSPTRLNRSAARATSSAARSRPIEDPRGAITIEHPDLRGELASDARDESGAQSTGDRDDSGRGANGAFAFDGRGMGLGRGGLGRGGSGRGTGLGAGDGGALQRVEMLSAPPAPKASLARPARLIFPTRQREVEDAELFVARVIVDDEGYVTGAKLVRGFGGRRDEVASNMIWKFRYDPARDDDGRAIRSTLEQRFLVGP